MKAIVWTAYGPPEVLQLNDVDAPTCRADEVLIRVKAATVTAGDCEARSLRFSSWIKLPMRLYVGIRRPRRIRILGQELAGVVEQIGDAVKRFKVGDAVFGSTGFRFGAYAEYSCLPAEAAAGLLVEKPPEVTFEEAAAIPTGGLEALHFLRIGILQSGEKILINGAGGSIGTFAVQLAKLLGAEVTAVDSGEKLEMLRSLGADRVVDYTVEDFTRLGETYDVILDVVGKSPYTASVKALKSNGRYLIANPRLMHIMRGPWTAARTGKRVIARPAGRNTEDLDYLGQLVATGALRVVIDRRYTLEETAEAHRYVDTGRKQGAVVIQVSPSPQT